jgi:hypothetical protein
MTIAVYYRMFVEDEPIQSRKPVNAFDQTLGHILATSVTPPHTVDSLKRCITKAEGIKNFVKCDLFVDLTSEVPMGKGRISILANDRPGSTPERAMALVYSVSAPSQEVVIAPNISAPMPDFDSRFNKKIVAVQDCSKHKKHILGVLLDCFHADNSSVNCKFLNFKKNEILATDGTSRREMFTRGGGGEPEVF